MQDNSGAAYDIQKSLEYSSNRGIFWTPISNIAGNAFWYQINANVAEDPLSIRWGLQLQVPLLPVE